AASLSGRSGYIVVLVGAGRLPLEGFRRPRDRLTFEHDPEKWAPAFREDHAQTKRQSGMTIVIALKGARYSGDRWSRARAFISLRSQPETDRVLVKADRLVRTASQPEKTN